MVDARGVATGYSLVSWPTLRACGGELLDLKRRRRLAEAPFAPDGSYDYVLASSPSLARQVVQKMDETETASRHAVESVVDS